MLGGEFQWGDGQKNANESFNAIRLSFEFAEMVHAIHRLYQIKGKVIQLDDSSYRLNNF